MVMKERQKERSRTSGKKQIKTSLSQTLCRLGMDQQDTALFLSLLSVSMGKARQALKISMSCVFNTWKFYRKKQGWK